MAGPRKGSRGGVGGSRCGADTGGFTCYDLPFPLLVWLAKAIVEAGLRPFLVVDTSIVPVYTKLCGGVYELTEKVPQYYRTSGL